MKWKILSLAHADEIPDLMEYHPGSLNVTLDEPWCAPDDASFRRISHDRGMRLSRDPSVGADFLANGNYIHPYLTVTSINGRAVEGRLYFPGISPARWEGDSSVWQRPVIVGRIEILSRTALRLWLGIGPQDELMVEITLAHSSTFEDQRGIPSGTEQ